MKRPTKILGCAALGYAFGLIATADIATKLAGSDDLRSSGTGNPGAANAVAVLGKKWGLFVAAGDIAKGYVAGAIGRKIACSAGANVASSAAVVGHCYPVTSGFSGGKGIATSVGQVLATMPTYLSIDIAVAAIAGATASEQGKARKVAIATSTAWVGSSTIWYVADLRNPGGPRIHLSHPLAAAFSTAVIFSRFKKPGATA